MEIKSAEFIISNTNVDKCPLHDKPEYAFIGRSNVGKSSLINMLTNRKGLAMTSATPGKTLLINHFLINKDWYLRLCQARKEPAGTTYSHNQRLHSGTSPAYIAVRTDRQPSGTAKN